MATNPISSLFRKPSKALAGYSLQDLLDLKKSDEGFNLLNHIKSNPSVVRWAYFGGVPNNAGNIHLNAKPEASLGERITNGGDGCVAKEIYTGRAANMDSPIEIGEKLLDANRRNSPVDDRPVHVYFQGEYEKGAEKGTVDVRDFGIGIELDRMKETILRSKSGSKSHDSRYIGRYGQGGSTTFAFADLTVIFTRHVNSDKVGVALVCYCAPGDYNHIEGQKQVRSGSFMTLLDPQTGDPFEFDAYDSSGNEIFEPGTLVRHYGYEMDKRDWRFYTKATSQKSSFYKTMRTMFPNPPIPFAIYDKRDGAQGSQLKATVRGSFRSLSDDSKNKVEHSNSAKVRIGKGHAKLYWFVLNQKATRSNYIYNFTNYGYSGNVMLSGQTVEFLPTSLIREAELPHLERSIICFIDLDPLDDRIKDSIITSTRESVKAKYKNKLFDQLEKHLQADPEVQRIHEERRQSISTQSVSQATAEALKEYFEDFLSGDEGDDKKVKVVVNPQPPKVVPQSDPPTMLNVTAKRRAVQPGQNFFVRFLTDAKNDYFDPQTFSVTSSDSNVVDVSNWSISDDTKSRALGHKSIVGLKVNDKADVGDVAALNLTLEYAPGQTLEAQVNCVVTEKKEPKRGSKVPNISVEWVSINDVGSIQDLGLADADGNPRKDKVGCISREADGSVTVYLTRYNQWVTDALDYIQNNSTLSRRYEDYEEFFLNNFFDYQAACTALSYLLEDDKDPGLPSPEGEDETEFEILLKGVARSLTAYWKRNATQLVNM